MHNEAEYKSKVPWVGHEGALSCTIMVGSYGAFETFRVPCIIRVPCIVPALHRSCPASFLPCLLAWCSHCASILLPQCRIHAAGRKLNGQPVLHDRPLSGHSRWLPAPRPAHVPGALFPSRAIAGPMPHARIMDHEWSCHQGTCRHKPRTLWDTGSRPTP